MILFENLKGGCGVRWNNFEKQGLRDV